MQWRNTDDRYGAIAQVLHWAIFVLIALQFAGGELIGAFARGSPERGLVIDVHESAGLATLALIAVRLAWRLVDRTPPVHGPPWQRRAAGIVHAGLYAVMVAVPVAGIVVAAARGHDLALFGIALPQLLARDRAVARAAADVHEALAWALAAVVAVHAAAAFWHHVVARDATLARMLPRRNGVAPAR